MLKAKTDRRSRTVLSQVVFGLGLCGSLLLPPACRRDAPPPSLEFAAEIRTTARVLEAREGAGLPLRLSLYNSGRRAWDPSAHPPCLLSYHLRGSGGEMLRFDNRRFPLSRRIEPGESQSLDIRIRSPLQAGSFLLEFDLLREGVAWFADAGSPTLSVSLEVTERDWPDGSIPLGLEYGRYSRWTSSCPEIEFIYKLIRLTLEENETAFSGRRGRVSGFAPGTNYPQIWLRDAATIMPASRYFYGAEWLGSWLVEHLAFQAENGSLPDWINSRGDSEKNTTETDQEASAVQAAYQVYPLLGRSWLEQNIRGRSLIDRLESALLYVRENRWTDEAGGLVTGAHTADWGDVDLVDADHEAVLTDERTHWTADIYDQSMYVLACRQLARMLESLGQESRAASWEKVASNLARNTRTLLWREKLGYFMVHQHLDGFAHEGFAEEDIFAMGGNILAVMSGVAAPEQARSILNTALERQSVHEISTLSGTLLPPYPAGIFKHPLLDEPYEYQNGAQWDWFGGRLIYALFQNGFSRQAQVKLREIIRKNQDNRGFSEWENREGAPRGSDLFCGSAGSLALAVIGGYFGIEWEGNAPQLRINLGSDSAQIHLYQAADDSFLAYSYRFDRERDTLSLRIEATSPLSLPLRFLSPWETSAQDLEPQLQVKIDGRTTDFRLETRNSDVTIVLEDPELRGRDISVALR